MPFDKLLDKFYFECNVKTFFFSPGFKVKFALQNMELKPENLLMIKKKPSFLFVKPIYHANS